MRVRGCDCSGHCHSSIYCPSRLRRPDRGTAPLHSSVSCCRWSLGNLSNSPTGEGEHPRCVWLDSLEIDWCASQDGPSGPRPRSGECPHIPVQTWVQSARRHFRLQIVQTTIRYKLATFEKFFVVCCKIDLLAKKCELRKTPGEKDNRLYDITNLYIIIRYVSVIDGLIGKNYLFSFKNYPLCFHWKRKSFIEQRR